MTGESNRLLMSAVCSLAENPLHRYNQSITIDGVANLLDSWVASSDFLLSRGPVLSPDSRGDDPVTRIVRVAVFGVFT